MSTLRQQLETAYYELPVTCSPRDLAENGNSWGLTEREYVLALAYAKCIVEIDEAPL